MSSIYLEVPHTSNHTFLLNELQNLIQQLKGNLICVQNKKLILPHHQSDQQSNTSQHKSTTIYNFLT